MSSFVNSALVASQVEGIWISPDNSDYYMTKAPVVQVKSIQYEPVNGMGVTVQCCYCFKDHKHSCSLMTSSTCSEYTNMGFKKEIDGGLDSHSNKFTVPDCLGHYVSGCHDTVGSSNGYIISTQAWKLSGRVIVQPQIDEVVPFARSGSGLGSEVESESATTAIMSLDHLELTTNVSSPEQGLKRLKIQHESQQKSKQRSQFESQFDKLVAVSKIFLDRRLIQVLENENRLKISLYWKDHNCIKFREAMTFANQKPEGPNCDCICCSLSGRKNERNGKPVHGFDCTFIPYLQTLLLECSIVTKSSEGGEGIEHESTFDSIFDVSTHTYVYNIDAHLISMGGTGWYLFTYGARLWNERSIESVELKNFSLLFQKLYYDGVEDESDSGDA